MSVAKFYQMELEKLGNEFNKISLFTKHPLTIGIFRENVLKSYLRQFTPKNLSINSGFVYDFQTEDPDSLYQDQTRQVDCLIFDENNYSPFLKADDFVIIEPDSLYAGIEIKSKLTFHKDYDNVGKDLTNRYPLKDLEDERPYRWGGTLVDALENIKSIAHIGATYKLEPFLAIFAYASTVNLRNFLFAFDNGELQRQLNLRHLKDLPTYICVPDSYLLYFGKVSLKEDENDGYDPSQSEMTVIESVESNKGFPLQFFTNALKIHLDFKLTKKTPHKSGLFTAGKGIVKMWGDHFDLNCD